MTIYIGVCTNKGIQSHGDEGEHVQSDSAGYVAMLAGLAPLETLPLPLPFSWLL